MCPLSSPFEYRLPLTIEALGDLAMDEFRHIFRLKVDWDDIASDLLSNGKTRRYSVNSVDL